MIFFVKCRMCGTEHEVSMTVQQYEQLVNRTELIQRIFPEKSPVERELLISKTCGECWDNLFGADNALDLEPDAIDA